MNFEHGGRRNEKGSCDLQPRPQPEYRINLTVAVVDPHALWAAAAAKLLTAPGMTLDDAVDVIGPCEDPSIDECIATLAMPEALPGCIMDDFWIDSLRSSPQRIDVRDAALEYKLGSVERGRHPAPPQRISPPLAWCMLPPGQDAAQPN
ncbi:hypothetical protein WSK_2778 [Novosphingobium sp. Rr 2-17]|uniref:hypothetical protein n=1 Tax=Novosphingobium sp. Rr 2-17 TaxID=555793 RepID=UPI000269953F|nr:hypothetical protein [Novosphingobium sp. Rr 2-17]EIZ78730.1 hypothetical protein WSK_2778 [Novosphingobium sp. Rr 2-17]